MSARFFAVFLVFLNSACRPRQEVATLKDIAGGQAFVEQLDSFETYAALARKSAGVEETFVKFTHYFGVPLSDPVGDKLYFQDTKRFGSHEDFLKANISRYAHIENYEALILPPVGGDGPSTKEITAGAAFLRRGASFTGFNGDTFLGYEIYFHTETGGAAPKTKVDVEEVARFHAKIKAAVGAFVPQENIVFLLPQKQDQFLWANKLKAKGVRSIAASLFHPQPIISTAYVPGKSYGFLRKISGEEIQAGQYGDHDILVLDLVPLDVNPVAGIVSSVPQTGNSHVIFRAEQLKIPDLFIPNALEHPQIKKGLGKLVELVVEPSGAFNVTTIDENAEIQASAEAWWEQRRNLKVDIVSDLSVKELFSWKGRQPSAALTKAYGAKGTNFAIIDSALREAGIDRSLYDASFLVPLSMYARQLEMPIETKHCKKAASKCSKDLGNACDVANAACVQVAGNGKLGDFVSALTADDNRAKMLATPLFRREWLFYVKRLIREVDLAQESLAAIRERIRSGYPETRRMRLRSSTNAEDLAGLTGAGLYESKGACLGDGDDPDNDDGQPSKCRTSAEMTRIDAQIARLKATPDPEGVFKKQLEQSIADLEENKTQKYPLSQQLREVYASLWTERAFMTRELYRIDHNAVSMGVLVHPAFIDEAANGVADCRLLPDGSAELNIVAQAEDVSITNPSVPGATAEQTLVTLGSDGLVGPASVKSHSSLVAQGQSVLSRGELEELARQIVITAKALRQASGGASGNRYDVEFMLDQNRSVLIKQGRPLEDR